MLHELIFVLSGFPSDVFIPFPSDDPCTFSINPDFPLLHPAERESLNRLGQLGWIYAKLNTFSVKQDAYAQAMATALEATLEEYRRDILDMERLVLDKTYDAGGGVVPISLLASSLGRWELLLPALLEFTNKFDACEYRGCKLLDLVLDEARTGNSDYRDVMHKVADRLHDVLYRQITSWMVYGNWTNDEFFITKSTTTTTTSNNSTTTAAATAGWQRRYGLALEQIPKHIPLALAESVLFVGKAVATVNQMGNNPMPDTMKQHHLQLLLSLRQQQQSLRQYDPLKQVVQKIRRSTADWLFSCVLTGEHSLQCYFESFRHMFLLGYGDLASNFIIACAEWRRRSLAKYPHDQHHKTTMVFRHQEFNALLAKASVGTEAEDQMDGYCVEIMQKNETSASSSSSLFSRLLLVDLSCTLHYDMRWPIDLFLSKEDLQCYSDLWTFMTGLRNIQMSLSDLWISLRNGPSNHEARAICRLRSYMLFWVDTLWNHIQSNVINPHYQRLIQVITGAKRSSNTTTTPDFEDLQAAHTQYLRNIMQGCLILTKDTAQIMYKALRMCQKFCAFVQELCHQEDWQRTKRRRMERTASDIVNEWAKPYESIENAHMEQIIKTEKEFSFITDRFFTLVSDAPQEIKANGSLDILLLQLDYNKWFSDNRIKSL